MNPSASHPPPSAQRLLLVLAFLLLACVLLVASHGGMALLWPWMWFLVIALALTALILGRASRAAATAPSPHLLATEELPPVVRDVMDVQAAEELAGARSFRGTLRASPDVVFRRLRDGFGPDIVPLLQSDHRGGAVIVLLPQPVERAVLERKPHLWVNWLLFALTLVTTTWAGAAQQGINLLQTPGRFAAGLPYAVALLAILGIHELGHYVTARRHAMNVTPPYFIPVPFALGTFGAFIRMRSPSDDRRTLFDVAVAGPLAGLVVAIPVLLLGLRDSTIVPAGAALHAGAASALPASSILVTWLAQVALGDAIGAGDIIRLSPLAFAGWLGLFITGLNLLPIGQLDGGHAARAMFGSRIGGAISRVAMLSLFLLGLFVWPGLLTWAVIVFLIAGRGVPPLNDLTPIGPRRFALGLFTFAVLLLILIPADIADSVARIHL